jgi:hypothetical protein
LREGNGVSLMLEVLKVWPTLEVSVCSAGGSVLMVTDSETAPGLSTSGTSRSCCIVSSSFSCTVV